jgi:CheY-like chemotaxis protein
MRRRAIWRGSADPYMHIRPSSAASTGRERSLIALPWRGSTPRRAAEAAVGKEPPHALMPASPQRELGRSLTGPEHRPSRRCFFLMDVYPKTDLIVRQPCMVVVENEALLRSVTVEFLRLSSYVVAEAATGVEALFALASGEPADVIFSDVCLPGTINGLALAFWLSQRQPPLPVILTTGHGHPVRQAAINLVGDELFLSKPYSPAELVRRIRLVLRGRQAYASRTR